jgi:hypothetical protein
VSSITWRSFAAVCGLALIASSGCGGGKKAEAGTGTPVGQDHHSDATSDFDDPGNDPTPQTGPAESLPDAGPESASNGGDGKDPGDGKPKFESDSPVVFRLMNTGDEDLVFSMDRGWQPVIFAYSGEPPNATPIIMFPKFCTASCDADDTCPYCPQPTRTRDIKAAEKRETIAPGKSLDVKWDAEVFVYQKVRKKCECHDKAPVPAETYTIKACGFRITDTHKSSSVYQCVDTTMTFPHDGAQLVELEFPNPPEK